MTLPAVARPTSPEWIASPGQGSMGEVYRLKDTRPKPDGKKASVSVARKTRDVDRPEGS